MKKWTYGLLSAPRDAIKTAVDDPDWQRFRESLRGTSTEFKLLRLESYAFGQLGGGAPELGLYSSRVDIYRAIRVSNYLNALKRGGQLNIKLEVVR